MKASRLLSMLILLQTRGTMTAEDLARELEVSVRTVYRDLDALGMAGVPVYAVRGPGGGLGLLEEYRTTLTGLTADEARALFMLSIPSPLMELGVGPELKTAMLKLSAALPEARQVEQKQARQRIHLDARGWGQPPGPGQSLEPVQAALWKDKTLRITTRLPYGAEVVQEVAPLGLVAKAGEWHLVALVDRSPRVFQVRGLVGAVELKAGFDRPEDFDLAGFWEEYCRQTEARLGLFAVRLRISAGLARELHFHIGEQAGQALAQAGPPDESGWREVEMLFDSHEQARGRILAFGGGAEVLEPLALRRSVEDIARQIIKNYP